MKIVAIAIGVALTVSSFSLIAQPVQSEKQANDVIQYRQSLLQLVKSNVGVLGAMAKGKVPIDSAVIEKNAKRIKQLSLMMQDYFEPDTSSFDMKTDALPRIWNEFDQFSNNIKQLSDAATELESAAANKQESLYPERIGAIFKSCKGCHDSYKAD